VTGAASTLMGLITFYSQAMIAYGQGVWLRRASIVSSVVLGFALVALVPRWGAMGASVAYAFLGATSLGLTYFYYRQAGRDFTFRLRLLRWVVGSSVARERAADSAR
jgi:O-antigen/teichoic acid export membrane protein